MATKKKAKKNKGLSIAIIILIVLIIFILLIVKKDIIITNLKETNFFGRVFGSTPEFVEKHKSSEKTSADINTESTVTIKVETEKKPEQQKKDTSSEKKSEQTKTETKEKTESKASTVESEKTQNNAAQKEAEKTAATEETKAEAKTEKKEAETQKKQTTEVAYTELQLYFIEIDADGSVIRKNVKRTIPKNDSPLVTALNLLLAGPDTTKTAEKNCMSLIPEGTKLLGAKVQNGIAYLDFSENFEFNSYGVEGYNGQLMQIVYTATNFSTVKSVQFLIEGKKKEYLGSEGQWIGSPLSRSAF